MKLFAADLDNTLIYSNKYNIGKEKVCVELYQGEELSYMTRQSLELLAKIKDCVSFVPTTTRTKEQYQRITFLDHWRPNMALVCNGGMLLIEDQIDTAWYEESLALIRGSNLELEKAIKILGQDVFVSFEIRKVNELFVFTKSNKPLDTIRLLRMSLNERLVDVFHNGYKVYVVPKQLTKGKAVERLQQRLKADGIISAGDSEFDLPMLNISDIAFAERQIGRFVENRGQIVRVSSEGEVFSDFILREISEKYSDVLTSSCLIK